MPKKHSNNSKQTSLFDIRLKNHDHDVLVLKGPPEDAGSALLSGKIVLSVKEPLAIKKLGLRLYATLRLNWSDSINTQKGSYPKNIRHERKVYEHTWDNMEINKYLNNLYDNSSSSQHPISSSKNNSTTSLKSLGHFRTKSSNNLSSLKHSPSNSTTNLSQYSSSSSNLKNNNHVLVQGNYEFPFSAILPGSMPESVEGLPGASVVYKLEATIDRGKFHNVMTAKKHMRVVRTLTTDAVELSETVAVDNTWPKKVEYSLNVPSKAIAIGSGTPISLMLVPLLKGLRLGETKIHLVEYYSYMGYVPPVHNGERTIVSKTIPKPQDDDPDFQMDKWEIDTFLRIPPSLSKCTQDCDIMSNIKVRHKIKFAIGLVNPDGHVSELRASLPIQLFISPFVSVTASNDDGDSSSETNQPTSQSEEVLFTGDRSQSSTSLNNQANTNGNITNSNSSSFTSFSGLVAPPLYEQHIYDRLWSDVSPIDSPYQSGTSTPNSRDVSASSGVQDEFSMSPIDSVQLNENLRLLSLQRQAQETGNSTPSSERATFSLEGESGNDYFGNSNPNASARRPILSARNSTNNYPLMSPGVASPAMHLSRTQSETVLNSPEMLQVPSYREAIKTDADENGFSPVYEPPLPGSNVNLDEANKNYEDYVGCSGTNTPKPPISRGASSFNLRSSNNSSPSFTRNSSSSNLSNLMSNSKISANKIQASSSSSSGNEVSTAPPSHTGPQSPVPAHHSQIGINRSYNNSPNSADIALSSSPVHQTLSPSSLAQPSNSATNRNAALGTNPPLRSSSSLSLHNLSFLNKKKEKK